MRYVVKQQEADGGWKEVFKTDWKHRAIREAEVLFRLSPRNATIVIDVEKTKIIKKFEYDYRIEVECNGFHLYNLTYKHSFDIEERLSEEVSYLTDEWSNDIEYLIKWLRRKIERPDYTPDEINLDITVYEGNIALYSKKAVITIKGDRSQWKRFGF